MPRLYRQVRPGARFERSLELLRRAKEAGLLTKSGIMVGLGEEWDEVLGDDPRASARPAPTSSPSASTCGRASQHLPIRASTRPEEFAARSRSSRRSLGYAHVESGPLVRSSYHAEEQVPRRGR